MTRECDGTELSEIVLGLIEKEESESPAWIKEGSSVSKNSSTTDQIKSHLRHIVLPHSIHSYELLKRGLSSNRDGNGNGDRVEDAGSSASSSSSFSSSSSLTLGPGTTLALSEGADGMIGSAVGSLSAVTSSNSKNNSIVRMFFDRVKSDSNRGEVICLEQHTTVHHAPGNLNTYLPVCLYAYDFDCLTLLVEVNPVEICFIVVG